MSNFPGKSHSPVSDQHLRAIGAIIVNWSALEMMMELMILGLYDIGTDRGLVITSNLSFPSKITILQILSTRGAIKDPADVKLCGKLLERLKDAHIQRNTAAHSMWMGGRAQGL